MTELICKSCHSSFEVYRVSGHKYCSDACRLSARSTSAAAYKSRISLGEERNTLVCPECKKDFEPTGSNSIFCSKSCRARNRRTGSTCSRCSSHFLADIKGQKLCQACRNAPCKADGCEVKPSDDKRRFKLGYCNPHYLRFKSHGDPLGGNPSPAVLKAIDHSDGTRTCSKCGIRKPLNDYYSDKLATLGKRSYCKECQKAGVTANYSKDPEKKKSYQRRHRKLNLARVREADTQRYERDKDKRISLVENQLHKRRARRNQAPFEEGITRIALRKRDGDYCSYCSVELNFVRAKNREFTGHDATIEHRLPLSRGGSHVWDNVVLACRNCNLSKGSKTEEEFVAYLAEIEELNS